MAGNICSETGGFHETINHEVFIAESEFRIYADCNNCEKDLICVTPFSGITSNVVRKDYDMRNMKQEELMAEIKKLEALYVQRSAPPHRRYMWEVILNDYIERDWDISKNDMIQFLGICERAGETIFYEKALLTEKEKQAADKCSHIPLAGEADYDGNIMFKGNCKNCEFIIEAGSGLLSDADFFDVLDQYHL